MHFEKSLYGSVVKYKLQTNNFFCKIDYFID